MKIKFIGTGSGVTSLKRFHSSILFSVPKYNLLIDAGDGASKSLLSSKVSFKKIDGILISHLHPDHFSGIASLIVQMKLSARKSNLDIFIHKNSASEVKRFIRQSYIYYERLGFKIYYKTFENDERVEIAEDFCFTSKQNTHLDHYKIFDKDNLNSFSCSSFLFGYKNKNIMFTGDIGGRDDIYLFREEEISIMISEISHIKLIEIAVLLQTLRVDKIILTHISDSDEGKIKKFYKSLSKDVRERIIIAYDGMQLTILD